jgi:hypothetical protein
MSLTQTQKLFSVVSGLWVGSYIGIGFLVVPVLFSTIGDRQIAGYVAANLFKITAYIGLALSAFLMVIANHLVKQGLKSYRLIRWLLLGLLICTIGAACVLIPWMNSLREQALFAGLSIQSSSYSALFNRLHSISSVLFIIQALLGLTLVWVATKNAD